MLASSQNLKPFDKVKKNKKRKWYKNKRDSTNLANGVNKTEIGGQRKKYVSEIMCYNCNKKEHYVIKCLES